MWFKCGDGIIINLNHIVRIVALESGGVVIVLIDGGTVNLVDETIASVAAKLPTK